MSVFCFGFLISAFFERAKIASTISAILLLALLAPGFSIQQNSGKSERSVCSLSTVVAFYLTQYNILTFESDSIGVHWGNITEEYNYYQVSLGIFMMFLDCCIYFFVGVYLNYVLPSKYGVSLPWYFLCSPRWWRGKNIAKNIDDNDSNNQMDQNLLTNDKIDKINNQENFEPVPKELNNQLGISVLNLRKEFNTTPLTVAVNNISVNMYKSQIFCLQ